jgi:hypothetical protein
VFLGNGCGDHLVCVDQAFAPIGAYNKACVPFEESFVGPVHPFLFAPGAMHWRFGWQQRTATVQGVRTNSDFSAPAMSIKLLEDPIVPSDWAFRLEFVGDLIVDCGHNPLRTEIHPPTNVLMHLSTPSMVHAKRYSIFGWNRNGSGSADAAEFDLWPGLPEKGKPRLAYKILYPNHPGLPNANLDCQLYPISSPNRIRCRIPPGDAAGNLDVCNSNQRMHPSCATSVGGGLVEVYWE